MFGVRKGGVLSRGCVFWPPTCQAGVSSQLLYFENRVHTFNSLQISIWESQPEAFELGQAGSYACVSFLCHMASELNQHMENSLNASHSRPGWRFGPVKCTGFSMGLGVRPIAMQVLCCSELSDSLLGSRAECVWTRQPFSRVEREQGRVTLSPHNEGRGHCCPQRFRPLTCVGTSPN